VLASLASPSCPSRPGERYSYSNIGYGILGLALSRAARKPFRTLVQEQLFTPAKMDSSFFVIPAYLRERVAVGTANSKTETNVEIPAAEHLGRGYKVPNGGVYASAGDLCRLIAFTRTDETPSFSDEIWYEVESVQTPEDAQNGYGLGFFVEVDASGQRLLSHGGSVAGYTAYWAFDPDRRIGAAILRNYNSGRTNLGQVKRMVREIARATK
jgi:CubicO group peptidase (beta-lactamase class C family)